MQITSPVHLRQKNEQNASFRFTKICGVPLNIRITFGENFSFTVLRTNNNNRCFPENSKWSDFDLHTYVLKWTFAPWGEGGVPLAPCGGTGATAPTTVRRPPFPVEPLTSSTQAHRPRKTQERTPTRTPLVCHRWFCATDKDKEVGRWRGRTGPSAVG